VRACLQGCAHPLHWSERERERKRERESVCVCVCVRERESVRERETVDKEMGNVKHETIFFLGAMTLGKMTLRILKLGITTP